MRSCTALPLIAATLAAAALAAPAAFAAPDHHMAVDVPARLGASDYMPNQVVWCAAGGYSPQLTLPAGVSIGALHRRPDGSWLFAFTEPVTLGGAAFEPRDVARWDGAGWSLYFDGSAASLDAGAAIDALFQLGDGSLVLSFEDAMVAGTFAARPSDLVRWSGSFSTWWSASAARVPPDANVSGAALDSSGRLILSFEEPVRLGGVTYLPGQMVLWQSGTFSAYHAEPGWPAEAAMRDFAFMPPAASVPDGSAPGTAGVTIQALSSTSFQLTWGGSCSPADTDYAVYSGTMGGAFTGHRPVTCSTGGSTTYTVTTGKGSSYFLVVPRNALREGSYGRRSDGTERPPSATACAAQEIDQTCH